MHAIGHRHYSGSVITLLGAVALLAGCSLDAPVGDPSTTVAISVVAPLPARDSSKFAQAELDSILAYPRRLSAEVTILRLGAQDQPVASVGAGDLRNIEIDAGDRQLRLAGVVDIEPDQLVGNRYRLDLEVKFLGRDPQGEFRGGIVLDSGIEITVTTFSIGQLVPGEGRTEITQDATLCLSSSAVVPDGGNPGDPFCVIPGEFGGPGVIFRPGAAAVSFGYQRDHVIWEGADSPRTIDVAFRGALLPATVMTGAQTIGPLVPGRPDPVTVNVPLDVTLDTSGPGHPGEVLSGLVFLQFTDGLPPVETGQATLVRVP